MAELSEGYAAATGEELLLNSVLFEHDLTLCRGLHGDPS